MKNIIKWTLVQLLVVFIFGSCSDDFFKEVPSNRTTPDKNYNSKTDAIYADVAPLAILRDYVPQMVFANDLLSDLTVATDNADQYWKDINNHNFNASNPYINPSVLYQVVINANESLMFIDSIAAKDQDMIDIDVKMHKGNLIGIRSWAYFTVARLYGEAAYLPDNLPSLPSNLTYLPREVMYDTLINHLLPYLDIDYIDNLGNNSMYNKALIGEIYLEKQDYRNAKKYLQIAIEGYENLTDLFKVTNTYSKESWKQIFISSIGRMTEVMAAVPYSYNDNQWNPIERWYGLRYDYLAAPSNYIVDLFNTQENRTNKLGDTFRGLTVSYDTLNGNTFVKKYDLDPGLPFGSDIILYRAADIHLLFAEALNRSDSTDIALNILNTGYKKFKNWTGNFGIRQRANLKDLSIKGLPEETNLVEYVEDLIMAERAMELAFEGKRWTDLMRVARRRGASYLADRVAAKYSDPAVAERVRNDLNNEANWYLPVVK